MLNKPRAADDKLRFNCDRAWRCPGGVFNIRHNYLFLVTDPHLFIVCAFVIQNKHGDPSRYNPLRPTIPLSILNSVHHPAPLSHIIQPGPFHVGPVSLYTNVSDESSAILPGIQSMPPAFTFHTRPAAPVPLYTSNPIPPRSPPPLSGGH